MPVFVNNVEISDDAIFKEMQFHPADSQEEARDAAAQALLIRELLKQKAVEKKYLDEDASDEACDEAIERLIKGEVQAPEATKEACQRYYQQNIARFYSEHSSKALPFEEVEDKIRDYLQIRSLRHGIQSYILDVASRSEIVGFDLAATL